MPAVSGQLSLFETNSSASGTGAGSVLFPYGITETFPTENWRERAMPFDSVHLQVVPMVISQTQPNTSHFSIDNQITLNIMRIRALTHRPTLPQSQIWQRTQMGYSVDPVSEPPQPIFY